MTATIAQTMVATPVARKVDCQRHRYEGYAFNGKTWTCRACGEPQSRHETTDETAARNRFEVIRAAALAELDQQATETYTGKPGCACGCRGNYSRNPRAMKATVNKMRRIIEAATAHEPHGLMVSQGHWVGVDNAEGREATRTYTVYTDERHP